MKEGDRRQKRGDARQETRREENLTFRGRRRGKRGAGCDDCSEIAVEHSADFVDDCYRAIGWGISKVASEDQIIPAFYERALRDVKEPRLVGFPALLETFGNVRRDRDRCTSELRSQTEQLFSRKLRGDSIDVQHPGVRLLPHPQIQKRLACHLSASHARFFLLSSVSCLLPLPHLHLVIQNSRPLQFLEPDPHLFDC